MKPSCRNDMSGKSRTWTITNLWVKARVITSRTVSEDSCPVWHPCTHLQARLHNRKARTYDTTWRCPAGVTSHFHTAQGEPQPTPPMQPALPHFAASSQSVKATRSAASEKKESKTTARVSQLTLDVRILRSSQRCNWGFQSSSVWRCVVRTSASRRFERTCRLRLTCFKVYEKMPKRVCHRLSTFTYGADRNSGKGISNSLFSLSFIGVERWTARLANITIKITWSKAWTSRSSLRVSLTKEVPRIAVICTRHTTVNTTVFGCSGGLIWARVTNTVNDYRVLVGKPARQRPLEMQEQIKGLYEISWLGNRMWECDRMELALDNVQWQNLALTELRLRISLAECQLFG